MTKGISLLEDRTGYPKMPNVSELYEDSKWCPKIQNNLTCFWLYSIYLTVCPR